MSKKNMQVSVIVTVAATTDAAGAVTGVSATYAQGETEPLPVAGKTVVAADGSIDLNALDKASGSYRANTDISWTVNFPALRDGMLSLLSPKTQSIAIQPWDRDMVPSASGSATQLELEDKGRANASYTYAILLAWQPGAGGLPRLFMLDPPIVNRAND